MAIYVKNKFISNLLTITLNFLRWISTYKWSSSSIKVNAFRLHHLENKLKTIYLKPVLEIYTGDADDDNWRKT